MLIFLTSQKIKRNRSRSFVKKKQRLNSAAFHCIIYSMRQNVPQNISLLLQFYCCLISAIYSKIVFLLPVATNE